MAEPESKGETTNRRRKDRGQGRSQDRSVSPTKINGKRGYGRNIRGANAQTTSKQKQPVQRQNRKLKQKTGSGDRQFFIELKQQKQQRRLKQQKLEQQNHVKQMAGGGRRRRRPQPSQQQNGKTSSTLIKNDTGSTSGTGKRRPRQQETTTTNKTNNRNNNSSKKRGGNSSPRDRRGPELLQEPFDQTTKKKRKKETRVDAQNQTFDSKITLDKVNFPKRRIGANGTKGGESGRRRQMKIAPPQGDPKTSPLKAGRKTRVKKQGVPSLLEQENDGKRRRRRIPTPPENAQQQEDKGKGDKNKKQQQQAKSASAKPGRKRPRKYGVVSKLDGGR